MAGTKEQVKAQKKRWRQKRRYTKQQFVMDYLTIHSCVDCGESDPVVLDFDHVRGEKRLPINTIIVSWLSLAVLKLEIEKCEVRCANCHRRRHARKDGFYRTR
jgi:hypothetical protein